MKIFLREAKKVLVTDMKNKMTGSEIAYRRAYIKFLKHVRDTEFVPQLAVLKHTYSCMEQAFDFNPKDNNARLMKRAIDNYSAAVDMILKMTIPLGITG